MNKFQIGDKVIKPKGYRFEGEVRGVFTNRLGETRVAVELVNEIPELDHVRGPYSGNGNGMIHIFSENQLEKA